MSDQERTDAFASRDRARANLAAAKASSGIVARLEAGLSGILEDNHFSIRIGRAYGLEPPEK